MKQKFKLAYYIITSIISFILIILLIFFNKLTDNNYNTYDKLLVGVIFITSCIFGLSFTLYPGWLKKISYNEDTNSKEKINIKNKRTFKGHHPDCKKFHSHTIKIKNKTYCAGCFGLTFGSLFSILLMMIYVLLEINLPTIFFNILIIVGFILISISFLVVVSSKIAAIFHILANILLIISFYLITISIIEITGNVYYGVIIILLSFLWIDTRIQLTKWQHHNLCNTCNEFCKKY